MGWMSRQKWLGVDFHTEHHVRELAWYVTATHLASMEGSEGVWRLDSWYNDEL